MTSSRRPRPLRSSAATRLVRRCCDLEGNRTGRRHGDGVGWRLDAARHHDREQRRVLELHHRQLGGRQLHLHRDRHHLGRHQRRVEPVRCDRASVPPLRRPVQILSPTAILRLAILLIGPSVAIPSPGLGPEIFIDTNAEGSSTYAAATGLGGLGRHHKPDHRNNARSDLYAKFLAAKRSKWCRYEATTSRPYGTGQTLLSLTNAAAVRLYRIYLHCDGTGSTYDVGICARRITQASGIWTISR